ncbi:hypothetical protein FF1_017568 [Malus domestica]
MTCLDPAKPDPILHRLRFTVTRSLTVSVSFDLSAIPRRTFVPFTPFHTGFWIHWFIQVYIFSCGICTKN